MPRNMSFFLTQHQVRDQSKTVTRRLGWDFLKPGDIVNACVKCQGLGKGGKIERICQIKIKSTRNELLCEMSNRERGYGRFEVIHEGFPEKTAAQFVEMFCEHMNCGPRSIVNRIEFEYVA